MNVAMRWLLLAVMLASGVVHAGTLDRVRETGVFKLGYRLDAIPFAYKNAIGEPAGYAVDLCRNVAVAVKSVLKLKEMDVEYVPVTAENRFDELRQGRIDILCGPTTATLSRRAIVDFSLFTFIDGASVLLREDGPENFKALAGYKVGVRAGTTTENTLRNTLAALEVKAEVVPVDDHRAGLEKLEEGEIAAYFADQAILVYLMAQSSKPESLRLSDRLFTTEPYALALARGDDEFRLLVDRVLSRLYRSGQILKVFENAFGDNVEPTKMLAMLYLVNGLPE